MDFSGAERIKAVVKWYSGQTGKTQREIGGSIGYPKDSIFSQFLNGHKEIPKALPEKIASLDPRINIDYLTGDSDDMLLPGNVQPVPGELVKRTEKPTKQTSGVYLPTELVQMFSDLSAAVRSQQETIDYLIKNR